MGRNSSQRIVQKYILDMNDYETEIRTIVRPAYLGFIIFWDTMVAYRLYQNFRMEDFYLFGISGIFASGYLFHQILTRLEICISDENLLLTYKILNLTLLTNSYRIKDISNIGKKNNVEESTGWGSKGFVRWHTTPVVLYFTYKNKKRIIGKTFSWPQIDETIHEIKMRQRKVETNPQPG